LWVTDVKAFAWIAFGAVLPVAALGFAMQAFVTTMKSNLRRPRQR